MGHILERSTEFLDRNILLRHRVIGGADDALGPGPDGFEVLISFEDGESCVTDLNGVEMLRRLDRCHGYSGWCQGGCDYCRLMPQLT